MSHFSTNKKTPVFQNDSYFYLVYNDKHLLVAPENDIDPPFLPDSSVLHDNKLNESYSYHKSSVHVHLGSRNLSQNSYT